MAPTQAVPLLETDTHEMKRSGAAALRELAPAGVLVAVVVVVRVLPFNWVFWLLAGLVVLGWGTWNAQRKVHGLELVPALRRAVPLALVVGIGFGLVKTLPLVLVGILLIVAVFGLAAIVLTEGLAYGSNGITMHRLVKEDAWGWQAVERVVVCQRGEEGWIRVHLRGGDPVDLPAVLSPSDLERVAGEMEWYRLREQEPAPA